MPGRSDPRLSPMKPYRGRGGGIQDGNCGKIKAMSTSNYFIIRQVTMFDFSDHCVFFKRMYAQSIGL